MEARNIGDRTKKIWGFDNFKGFGALSPEDGTEYAHVHKTEGDFIPEGHLKELQDVIRIFDEDRFVSWKKRIELVIGDVVETVPQFGEEYLADEGYSIQKFDWNNIPGGYLIKK